MTDYLVDMARATQQVWHAAYQEGYEQAKLDLARQVGTVAGDDPLGGSKVLKIIRNFVVTRPTEGGR